MTAQTQSPLAAQVTAEALPAEAVAKVYQWFAKQDRYGQRTVADLDQLKAKLPASYDLMVALLFHGWLLDAGKVRHPKTGRVVDGQLYLQRAPKFLQTYPPAKH